MVDKAIGFGPVRGVHAKLGEPGIPDTDREVQATSEVRMGCCHILLTVDTPSQSGLSPVCIDTAESGIPPMEWISLSPSSKSTSIVQAPLSIRVSSPASGANLTLEGRSQST
jgi:hypothetical protein